MEQAISASPLLKDSEILQPGQAAATTSTSTPEQDTAEGSKLPPTTESSGTSSTKASTSAKQKQASAPKKTPTAPNSRKTPTSPSAGKSSQSTASSSKSKETKKAPTGTRRTPKSDHQEEGAAGPNTKKSGAGKRQATCRRAGKPQERKDVFFGRKNGPATKKPGQHGRVSEQKD